MAGMILSDGTIKKLLKSKKLVIEPISEEQIQPASVDVTLGDTFLQVASSSIDLAKPVEYTCVQRDTFRIEPKSFLLATTREYIRVPNDLTAFVEGRSSIGRIGLFVQNAGWVDPGFEGQITLELFNATDVPIILHKDWRIGQLVFAQMDREAEHPYSGKYQGQTGATGSEIWLDVKH